MTSLAERFNYLIHGEQYHRWDPVQDMHHFSYPNVTYPPIPVASDNVVWGPDVSGYYDGIVNWKTAFERGARFCIIKIADGTIKTKYAGENVSGALSAGLIVLGYCWLYRNVRISGRSQGTAWSNIAKSLGVKYVAVDYEWTFWGGQPDNPDQSDLYGAVIPFEQEFGSKPLIYSAPGYAGVMADMWKVYKWWQAQYAVLHPSPVAPWGLNGQTFWQLTDRWQPGTDLGVDPANAKQIDGNLFNGSLPQLYATFPYDIVPTPPVDIVTNPFQGVKVTLGRRFDSDIQVIEISKSSINPALSSVICQGRCDKAENVYGDIVSNGGDFDDITCVPVGLCIAQDALVSPQAGFEPAIGINLDGSAEIDHKNVDRWPNAIGLKRYLVENGAVSPNTSPAWNDRTPRKIYGVKQNGDMIILSSQGWVPGQAGLDLFQCAEVMIEFGAQTAGDGDGGYSVQTRVGTSLFTATPSRHDEVADFISIKIKSGGTTMTKGLAKTGTNTNVKRKSDGVILATLKGGPVGTVGIGDTVYGVLNPTNPPTDIMDFDHFYRMDGSRFDLFVPCKVSTGNLILTNDPEPGTPPPPAPPPVNAPFYTIVMIEKDDGTILKPTGITADGKVKME